MKKINFIFLIIFLFFSSLLAEIAKEVIINGNERISKETIKVYGGIELNKNYTEADVNNILKDLYGTGFFESVEVFIQQKKLIINLKEYPSIDQLIIIGEKSEKYKKEIKSNQFKEKRSLIKSNLVKDADLIKSLYSSLGYNFAKVETKLKNWWQHVWCFIWDKSWWENKNFFN